MEQIKQFSVEIILPTGRPFRIPECSNRDYLTILKFCENEDYQALDVYLNTICKTSNLNIIERLYVFVCLKFLFVDDKISFQFNGERVVEILLEDILKKIDQSTTDYRKTISIDNIELVLDLPKASFFNTYDDLFYGVIHNINHNNQHIIFHTITQQQQKEILDVLPDTVFKEINKYIKTLTNAIDDIVLVQEQKDFDVPEVKFGLISNSGIQFICSLFKTNMMQYYEAMYQFIKHINNDMSEYFKMTPMETKLLFNIHNKEVERQNKELKEDNSMTI